MFLLITKRDVMSPNFQVVENDDDGGFLKLSKTNEWISGDNSAPLNKKVIAKVFFWLFSFSGS